MDSLYWMFTFFAQLTDPEVIFVSRLVWRLFFPLLSMGVWTLYLPNTYILFAQTVEKYWGNTDVRFLGQSADAQGSTVSNLSPIVFISLFHCKIKQRKQMHKGLVFLGTYIVLWTNKAYNCTVIGFTKLDNDSRYFYFYCLSRRF